jgi:capsular exopolysaccharide synthesis family protein
MQWLKKNSLPVVLPFQQELYSREAGAYRKLATTLLSQSKGQGCQTLLITSAQRGEGKSTTAINLAFMLQEMGKRVLLVDADLERPVLNKALNLSNESGLTDYLINASETELKIQSMAEGLTVITNGAPLETDGALSSFTNNLESLIDLLKPKAEYIIIDTSALLDTGAPLILAALVDWVLLVVRQGVTSRQAGQQALALLQGANANILGVVLNDVRPSLNGYHIL